MILTRRRREGSSKELEEKETAALSQRKSEKEISRWTRLNADDYKGAGLLQVLYRLFAQRVGSTRGHLCPLVRLIGSTRHLTSANRRQGFWSRPRGTNSEVEARHRRANRANERRLSL